MSDVRLFYTETIPGQWNAALAAREGGGDEDARVLEGMRAVDATIRVDVSGEGGGRFFLNVSAGRMTAGDAPEHPPFLALIQDRTAFERVAEEAGESALALLGGLAGLPGDIALTRTRVENLAAVRGLLRLEVTGERGFEVLTHFGGGPLPEHADVSVRLDEEAFAELRAGRLDPGQAFMDGRVEIEGDVTLVMQIALSALS